MKVGINGMGRIGRLALRAAMGAAERQADDPRAGNRLDVVHLNEIKGGAAATAHLLAVRQRAGHAGVPIWPPRASVPSASASATLSFSAHASAADIPWGDLGCRPGAGVHRQVPDTRDPAGPPGPRRQTGDRRGAR
ncbi:MAG: glyceraldehyde 3-phosphate dehydrogenase NAD-binding domain-containing protein [Burkholderiaceae bacterium]